MSEPQKRTKNKQRTKQHILKTVQQILVKHGGQALSLSHVVKEAGVARTLVYRYFGSFEGLMQAYADSEDFFPDVDELIGISLEEFSYLPMRLRYKRLRDGYWTALVKRPHAQAILAWSMVESNPITEILEKKRQQVEVKVLQILLQGYENSDFDYEAMHILLSSAFFYIGLHMQAQLNRHGDVPQSSLASLTRLENTAETMMDAVEFYIAKQCPDQSIKA